MNIIIILCLMDFFLLKEAISVRLVKVVVPAYEIHGNFALLECQYELNNNDSIAILSQQYASQNQHQASQNQHQASQNQHHNGRYTSQSVHQNIHHALQNVQQNVHHGSQNQQQKVYYEFQKAPPVREEEGETLYSVKWYKDNEEFYRYIPTSNPIKQSYKVDGIKVDHDASSNVKVKLKRVTLKSSGVYRCEVSAEAPAFSSVEGEGRMEIIYLPKDGPEITGEEIQYQIGDVLNLNCTSGKAHPAPLVEWLINDEQVTEDLLVHFPVIEHQHGLLTKILGLQLVVDGRHFKNGEMRIKCVASVSPVLWQNGKESIVQRRPQTLENRQAELLVRSSSCRLFSNSLITSLIIINVIAIFM